MHRKVEINKNNLRRICWLNGHTVASAARAIGKSRRAGLSTQNKKLEHDVLDCSESSQSESCSFSFRKIWTLESARMSATSSCGQRSHVEVVSHVNITFPSRTRWRINRRNRWRSRSLAYGRVAWRMEATSGIVTDEIENEAFNDG